MPGKSDEQLDKMTEEMAEQVGKVYEDAGNEMRNIIIGYLITRLTLKKINEAMSKVDVVLNKTQKTTEEILDEIIPKVYEYGFESANRELPKNLRKIKLSPSHKDQIIRMIDDAKIDFGTGLNGAKKVAGQILKLKMKEQITNKIAASNAIGKSIPKTTKAIERLLKDQGFNIFITRDGKVWPLKYYSEMLTRTHVIRAANESTVARAKQLDINILEMSTHANVKDQACLDVQGELFDLTGKEYPKPPAMPIHPNCKHKLFLRPDLSKKNTK